MGSKNFLEEIVRLKKLDLAKETQKIKVSVNQRNQRFFDAISKGEKIKLIAEIKFASPTSPHLGSSEELLSRAKEYELAGADAISIITERHFFKGNISFVSKVKKNVSLPVLQKDFVIDSAQIYEAKKAGSDALLLIARLVDGKQLQKFVSLCLSLEIEPVVEINDEEDLEKAVITETKIIAVNARDLETFAIDVVGACMLLEKIPQKFMKLGFSGVTSQKEALLYKESGVDGILVGTSLMKAKDIKSFINNLQL
jgi:indole-3-glycerol phosphate synthase